jgi:hypothetical protein
MAEKLGAFIRYTVLNERYACNRVRNLSSETYSPAEPELNMYSGWLSLKILLCVFESANLTMTNVH